MNKGCTYIVLLNWNGWRDTIACLQSLFALDYSRYRVLVCDNDSSDGSLSHIEAWCRGEIAADLPDSDRLRSTMPERQAPVSYVALTASEVGNDRALPVKAPLVLIDNEANLGFAGGNNVGLRFALAQKDMSHVWILNNDTLVERDCLSNMHRRLEREAGPAVCGSMIHFFDNPGSLQAIGGNRFNSRTGVALQSEGRFVAEGCSLDIDAIESQLDYISGCSMLMPRHLLESVGLLNDEYFLYYEEIDWFTRAGRSVKCCVAAEARIYHREGGSIGSPSLRQHRPSLTADFHIFRSKHLFMSRFYRQSLLFCYLSTLGEVGKRILRGHFSNARVVLAVLFGTTQSR